MSRTVTSGSITYIDTTDSRKLDVYIANNMPTVQIYNPNNQNAYSPDWEKNNLTLTASIYLDSIDVTDNDGVSIIWDKQIGTNITSDIARGKTLTIKDNISSTNNIITYICRASYKGVSAQHKIDFTRVDAGANGTNGSPAPAVQAQYSVDGVSGWTPTLNAATHKYIKYSYDGGKTWTTAIKMVGEDGTSVRIKGTATSATSVTGTDYYTLVYSGSSITGAELGDAYLYNGDLYVCASSRDGADYFINVGAIQGPAGNDGISSYVFIRYATDANGTGMSTNPSGKTYMGVYTSNTNVAPTTASSYTWSKFVGDSAKSIVFSGDSQVFKVSTSNVYTPATIKVTAQVFNTSVTTWTYSTNGGQTFVASAPTGVSLNGNVVTITGSTLTTNSVVIKASDGSVEDVFTVYKAFDGANGNPGAPGAPASMAFLTNENVTLAANANGDIATTSFSTNVVAYKGTTKETPTIGTISGLPTGMSVSIGGAVNSEIPITFTITNNSTVGYTATNNGSITIPVNGPSVYTNLILTWSKVNAGPQGPQGGKGNDSYTVLLTNESHIFAGDVANAVDGSTTTQVLAYNGSTAQNVTISSVNGKTASIADTDTGIAGLKFKCSTLSGKSPTITFTCTDDFVSPSGTIPIVLSVGGVSFTKMFTYSIAFKGATGGTGGKGDPGTPATSYWLVASASAVQKTSTGTITVTPSTLTFSGKSKTGTNAPVDYACRWIIDYSTNGTNYTNLYTSTTNEASKTVTVATTYKTIRARMYMAGGTTALIDEQIIPVVSDGATGPQGNQGIQGPKGNDAYTVILTNESHIFAGDVSNAIAGTAETQVLAYNGSTQQSITISSVNGKTAATTDSDTGITGLKFKCSTLSGTSPKITFTCTTAFVSKSGSIPIVISVGGVSFTKMFTYSIAFKGTMGNPGTPGTPASLVDITPSAYYFKSTTGKDGTFTPDYIYLYPRFQTVTFSKWEYSINGGTTWVAASGANGLSIGTYNSVANTLRIARTSTLYTDAVTSISFRCVSSTASVYDTVSIAKIYDVVDLQIGGTNLLKSTATLDGILVGESTDRKPTARGGAAIVKNYYNNLSAIKCNTIYQGIRFIADDFVDIFQIGDTYTFSVTCRNLTGGTVSAHSYFIAQVDGSRIDPVTSSTLAIMANGETKTASCSFTINQAILDAIKNGHLEISIQCQGSSVFPTTGDSALYMWGGKLEKGNKATDWSPAPEDITSTTFQIYAPKGYLLTNGIQELTLEAFAYDGSQPITNATFVWSRWDGEAWVVLSGATNTSLTVNKSSVFKSGLYRCQMTYQGNVYTATVTIDDKTDVYESLIRVAAKYSPTNRHYWILYTTAYSEEGERDALLGPISEVEPTNPTKDAYWYKIDETNYTATLMKYSGSAWATTTDEQELHYDWSLFKDTEDITAFGKQSKVVIVTSNDFSKSCDIQCNVFDSDNMLLSRSNQTIIDPSDPVISQTAPQNPIDGQLWIQLNNGAYVIYIWNNTDKKWIMSEADSQNKVYTEKPTSYTAGDIWIVGGDYQPTIYLSGAAQTTKYLAGTMLKAQYTSSTYKDSDWVEALNYKKQLDEVADELAKYKQYISIDDTGLIMEAKNANGQLSEFKTKLTNTELGFYQGDDKVAYINNNQLNISKAQITNGLLVSGTSPVLTIGGFSIIQEGNGSLSIITNI